MLKLTYLVKLSGITGIIIAMNLINGCTKLDSGPAAHFSYQFDPAKNYRVQAHYESTTQLVKMHQSKVFSDVKDTLYVNATYNLSTTHPSPSTIQVNYYLIHLSLNDSKGKIRVEIGPHGGQVTWYGEESTLATYLGPQAFKHYLSIITDPIASILVNRRGEQIETVESSQAQSKINLALLELLSKNRVLGKHIVRAFKIPPVLMTIFPEHAIKPGKKWSYQGGSEANQDEWQQALSTKFHYLKIVDQLAIITYQSQLTFKEEELNKLGQMLGMSQLDNMVFNTGHFKINGQADIDLSNTIPKQGKMEIEKKYSFDVKSEKWSYQEKELHQFELLEN